ncbi:MAG TPA: cyclic pyranopterin monophosphate synthase MoaC [Gemmatimonadaceae bacterium]|jgi:cyclic pyranopterin phosphate synthase
MKKLSHADARGRAIMVDISGKDETLRTARAEGFIAMKRETLDAIEQNLISKGDVLSTARIAGVMAAKRTADLIPLCHPIAITDTGVEFDIDRQIGGVRVTSWATTRGRTGVEMEALTAATVALLTIYDMAKAIDRDMEIKTVRLLEKRGGKSGDWERGDP